MVDISERCVVGFVSCVRIVGCVAGLLVVEGRWGGDLRWARVGGVVW